MSELLAHHTTLRLGGPAAEFVIAETEADLISAVQTADETGIPVLILGGGSNLVVGDDGFDGRVIRIASRGIATDAAEDDACHNAVTVTLEAGEPWDRFVALAVDSGWIGIEALSGIPGLVGATPIQNVGAYGQEVAATIASVRTWDRHQNAIQTFAAADCNFSYRMSRFKAEPDRYIVLQVTFLLNRGTLSAPIAYAELAKSVGVEVGDRRPMAEVRSAVLALRGGKGMVLNPDDHDTWSAGSFFTNPIVGVSDVPEGAPSWPQPDGSVKTSAAWLIDHAGFGKGYGNDRVSLSTKHALALTNRGSATTTDLLTLAGEIRNGVETAYGIRLVPEPVMVNCSL
ncbi:MAG TPA: UDP-N-acetylmuramate dehydrogenase [Marmoricola sp.]|nr:UDP-N-acetylmuramate dehydrogenase [Marmoricola sp.]